MKHRPRLPRFRTEEEEAEFWTTHDSADYWHEFQDCEPIELSPSLRRRIDREARRTELVALRLPPTQARLARTLAKRNGIPYSTQLRVWLSRGMAEDLREGHRKRRPRS